jgi:Ca-activated chloride channel family protein
MHELLCAYALGEADAAQRIEVERALVASPELRKELEKIEQTIGLVRESLGGGETMSDEAEKALMSAVSPEPRRSAWYASGWMRMAAGFLVVGGGALWMNMLYERNSANMTRSEVAQREKEEARKTEPKAGPAADTSALVAQLEEKDKRDDFYGLKVQTDGTAVPGMSTQDLNGFAGSGGGAGGQTSGTDTLPPTPFGAQAGGSNTEVFRFSSNDSLEYPSTAPEWRGQFEPGNPNVRLQGAPATGAPEPAGIAGRRIGAGKGTYRGPGDSAPAAAAPSGPSTGSPGGAGPSTPAPAAASERGITNEEHLALDGRLSKNNKAQDKDSEGKAKEERAKKLASAEKGYTPSLGAKEEAQLPSAPRAQWLPPDEEAQVLLRQLLERSDSAELERLARLKGDVPSQEGGKLNHLGYTLGYTSGDTRADEIRLREYYYKLTPEQRAALLDQECRRVFDGCRRLPDERPRDMFFRYWGDNPFEITALDALSTFSADVDTASYTLARRYLVEGKLPEKAQIRTEEFVNYFRADVPAPTKGTFAIHTDLAPSRFAQPANSTWTLRVVVRGQELAKEERKPLHLTCVIDCSGSMREQNRMETVKDTLRLLLTQLNGADMVGIVAFSTEARQILPLTSVANRGLIEVAIGQLAPDGWTNSEAGLKLGYATALAGLDANSTNRVVFLSDGVANQGVTDPVQLSESLKPIREKGVYLNTIGVGMNNHNDTLLEQLADKGDGMCSYVDDMREAKRVMMDNFMGSLETIARDVKIQVEFDPAQVARYRLLGYENRAVADADFRNDKVDAGEVGSGHQVTALYEIERNLAVGAEKPLATVHLRWKAPRIVNGPANEEATEITSEVLGKQQTSFEGADAGYRRAVIVGQFAEFLRRSVHARGRSIDELLAEAHKLEAQLPQDADFHEFVALAERSKQLVLSNLPNCDELCQAIDAYRTMQFNNAQYERLNHERQQQIVEDLARRNREMEEQIRELLRRRLENSPK